MVILLPFTQDILHLLAVMRKSGLDLTHCAVLELYVSWLALSEEDVGLDGQLSWSFVGFDDLAIVKESFIDLNRKGSTSR